MAESENLLDKAQHEGRALMGEETKDKVFSSENRLPDEQSAVLAFEQAVDRLFNVDAWSDLPGLSSSFELYDANGNRKKGAVPEIGDYVRIVLPGPLPENWVTVVTKRQEESMAEFTVRPSEDPKAPPPEQEKETKHFFSSEATSTFRVERKGHIIQAFEIGRNERVNNQGEEAGGRAIVNTLVAAGGWAGFQDIQWTKLTDYLVQKEEK
jgi:hypothetical protein